MTASFRHLRRLAAALAGAAVLAMPALAAPTVSVTGPATAAPGASLELQVVATDFVDLYAYQFDLTFNPAAFAATGVAEGSFLASVGATFFDAGQIDNTTGTMTFILNSLLGPGAGATGGGSLARLTFLTLAGFSGSATFAVSNVLALDSSLDAINVSLQGATVSPVPEPSVLLLSLAGLGMLAGGKLVRKARRTVAA